MPFYIRFGHFAISSFGLMVTIGLLISYVITLRLSKYIGIIKGQIDDIFIFATFFGIFLGRTFYIIKNFNQIPNFLAVFQIWNGGLDYYGAIVGVVLGVLAVSWFYNIPILKALDSTSIIGSFMLGFGYFSAGFVGFGFGLPIPSNVDITPGFHTMKSFPYFYVVYNFGEIAPPSIPFYPAQFLYGFLFLIYGISLIFYLMKKQDYQSGEIFSIFVILYGLSDMLIGHFDQSRLIFGRINAEQIIGSITFIIGSAILWLLKSEKPSA